MCKGEMYQPKLWDNHKVKLHVLRYTHPPYCLHLWRS